MKRARLNVVLSEDNYNKVTALSERWGVSKSNVVGVALGQYFDSLERKSKIKGEGAPAELPTFT